MENDNQRTCEIWHCGELAAKIKEEARNTAVENGKPRPLLEIITVGDDPASAIYVKGKRRDCEECGFDSVHTILGVEATTDDVLNEIRTSTADGIIVQLPLPAHIDKDAVIDAIPVEKDVDGFSFDNLGRVMAGRRDGFAPCTPAGIMRLLEEKGIELRGANVTVIGRSDIVGKPIANMLVNAGATVTVCNSKTRNLDDILRTQGDIVISAAGYRGLLTSENMKPGAIVVDVSINRDEDGKLCGDADESVREVAKAITPVPGGIGLLTRAMLMCNLAKAGAGASDE